LSCVGTKASSCPDGEKTARGEHLARLPGYVLRQIVGDLTGEVRRALMNARFAEACAGVKALDDR